MVLQKGAVAQHGRRRPGCKFRSTCPGAHWVLTLPSLGPTGQAAGSSRLRSSPSRMDEDLSEFREKASVSASCTCRERRPPWVTPGAAVGQAGPPERHRAAVSEGRDLSTDGTSILCRDPAWAGGWETTRGGHSRQSARPGLGQQAGELPMAVNQSWSACPQTKCPSRLLGLTHLWPCAGCPHGLGVLVSP